ncbi:MAG: putative flavoprotein involved in transport [Pseudonocardiales bacterium]|jgi:putative flavoprotein involved in K+ transport|nr:putative flavoprotein involved in transport [Pseudonocardiales bacterium]
MITLTNQTHFEVVIIGAGQAGLSLSRLLTEEGVDHVLLERETTAHEWRTGRWDNFTLVTPNWQCQLPGWSYSADDPNGFMNREQVHTFVTDYAKSFDAPVVEGVEVVGLSQTEDGYALSTSAGALTADRVVIATGGYHTPIIPPFADQLPTDIRQLHSSEYRNSGDLPAGAVLVVGSGQSGAQIAEDLHLDGRQVHLALGGAPRCARFYRGKDCIEWLHDMGIYDIPVTKHAGGLAKRESTNHYMTGRDGGRDIDLRVFATQGMELYGRLTGATSAELYFAPTLAESLDRADAVMDSIKNDIDAYIARAGIDAPSEPRYAPIWQPPVEPATLDLEKAGITSIVWSIGYRADYSWVNVGVFDGQGHPAHQRGVSPASGLYFLGLPWLYSWGSGRFAGIERDARFLADQIVSARIGELVR